MGSPARPCPAPDGGAEAEAGIVDLVYDKTGYPKGRSRLAPDTEQRLSAVIREVFEVGEKPKLSKACKIINAIFESEGRPALNVFEERSNKPAEVMYSTGICPDCLLDDAANGRVPFIRRRWSHP